MKAFIQSYCTISRIDSFDKGIAASKDSGEKKDVIHPEYKEVIPPAMIRRMSSVIRMGVGAAFKVKGDDALSGIIVGSGLGCLENTEKFLDQFTLKEEGVLAPTAFIQSTHNTIAGQIGLLLKANCYNSTYTQRGTSFENALIDAMMLSEETKGNVLVGGVDEKIALMDELADEVKLDLNNLGEGSSFFLLSDDSVNAVTKISACSVYALKPENLRAEIEQFLLINKLEKPDLLLYGSSLLDTEVPEMITDTAIENYSDISGTYMTNSGFGLQYAAELIEGKGDVSADRILIVNNFANRDFGLTYIEKP